jgi:FtsP/CotA-like multicopper oxidase with cupredoxin domain
MPQLTPFQDDLPIPPTIKPVAEDDAPFARFSIAATSHRLKLHKELPETEVWCYRQNKGPHDEKFEIPQQVGTATYLGPTVEVMRGQKVEVTWKNKIIGSASTTGKLPYEVVKVPYPDGTTPVPQNLPGKDGALDEASRTSLHDLQAALVVHLHGARVQSDSDGWPDDTCAPGQSNTYTYNNDQAATMLWYHDHAMHVTRLNVYAGLAGVWLVRDEEERSLALPDGRYEMPLVIQDRNLDLDATGKFIGALLHKTEVQDGPAEFFGPYTLVNGKIWPKSAVEPRLYRLRLLNGSNARTYRLVLLDDQGNSVNTSVWQIGCDQGLMQNRVTLPADGLILAPAERVDLLIDFAAFNGKSLYLWNTADAPFGDDPTKHRTPAQTQAELQALIQDPLAMVGVELDRRPYPQVMRFDVVQRLHGTSHTLPANPLWKTARTPLTIDAKTTIRMMGLVENPPPANAPIDATSTLVFWEYLPVTPQNPAPAGADVTTIKYWNPGIGAFETKTFWKAAEAFYDQMNWRIHLDSTELWYIVNVSPDTHPIHVHLVDFAVTQRFSFTSDFDDSTGKPVLTTVEATSPALPIEPNVIGPKDTVRVNPGEIVGIAMKFSPYPGRFIYHCHILEHEDHDMMRHFVVVPSWVPHHH